MEKFLHGLSGTLHILAAVTWIGSMIYSKFAVAPALKPLAPTKAQAVNMMAAKSFAPLTWTSLVVLIATGTYAVVGKWKDLAPLAVKPPGVMLSVKLLLVAALIVVLFAQIYYYGPKMKYLISPSTPKNQENDLALARTTRETLIFSNLHLATGIVIIIAAVVMGQLLEKG